MVDKKSKYDPDDKDTSVVSNSELRYILDINQKAIEIYVEVEKQNTEVLSSLERLEDNDKKIDEFANKISNKLEKVEELLKDDNSTDHQRTHDVLEQNKKDVIDLIKSIKTELSEDIDEKITSVNSKLSTIESNSTYLKIFFSLVGLGGIIEVIVQMLGKK